MIICHNKTSASILIMYQLSSTEPSIPCLQFSDGVLNGDKLFEQFIRGVNNAFENNNTFSVADMAGSHIFDEQPSCDRGQQLFIRPCYEKFLESVMALWFPNNQNFESVPVIVMGSGGTGKTTLKTILCKRIMEKINTTLSKNESQSIILQYGESQTYYHAHFRRTLEGSVIVQCTKETASGTYFVRNLPQQVYYLVETGAGDISKASKFQRIGKDHAVFFSRPSMSLTGGSLSTEDKAKTLCIPLWTLNELLQANYSLNLGIDSSELNERYKRFGGVARNVLECASSAAHNPHLSIPESSKESANIYAVFDIASIRFLGPELYNELILCRTALTSEGNYNFAGFTEEWASKRAALRVAGKFELLLSVQLHFETRTWKKNDGFSNKLSGYVFDVYPIHVLQTKGLSPFRIRSLKNTSAGVTIMRRLRRVTGMPQQSPQMTSRMRKWLGALCFIQDLLLNLISIIAIF